MFFCYRLLKTSILHVPATRLRLCAISLTRRVNWPIAVRFKSSQILHKPAHGQESTDADRKLDLLLTSGRWTDAQMLVKQLEDTKAVKSFHYCRLLKFAKTPYIIDNLVDRMTEHGIQPDYHVVIALMAAYERINNIPKAIAAFDAACSQNLPLPAPVYGKALAFLVKRDKIQEAYKLLSHMEKECIEISVFTYNRLINALAKAGKFSEALDALEVSSSRCH